MSLTSKIVTLETLGDIARDFKEQGRRVVLCHGTFDLLHAGHIRHLQRAREEGDMLLVTVTADGFVNKGPGRPVFSDRLRSETLAALSCVDYVSVHSAVTAIEVIRCVQPDVYAKGSDYRASQDDVTGNISKEVKAVEAYGGRVAFTDDITFSSSQLLNEHFGVLPTETSHYLRHLSKIYSSGDLISMIKNLSKLKVLVVGDAIVDEYHYTTQLGLAGKGNVMAVRYQSKEQFAGGSLAVANHIASFADEVSLVTVLGKRDSQERFIRSKLARNVKRTFFYREDAPTITKRRFVDAEISKLFEVYYFEDEPLPPDLDGAVCAELKRIIGEFDVVVVPDYGNGFITPGIVAELAAGSRFLAVNTQVNGGNRGYHAITRYPRADFVCLNEPELRLAAHSRHDPIESVIEAVRKVVPTQYLAVTRGSNGVLLTGREPDSALAVPRLSTKVIDRVGAGDAFLALASLCIGQGLPPEVAVFVGSAAAAIDVQIVCNREPISRTALCKYITTLLKWK